MHWSAKHNGYVDDNGVPLDARRPSDTRALGIRVALFLALYAILFASWEQARGTSLERLIVHDLTLQPAVSLVNWLTPEVGVRAIGFSMRAAGGGLNILNGCEGLDALFLLICAFVIAPIGWRERTAGLALGVAVVFVINQARILSLFYAYRSDHALFDMLHASAAPILVVLLVGAYFYAWLAVSSRSSAIAA